MKHLFIFFTCFMLLPLGVFAQRNIIHSPRIHTLQVSVEGGNGMRPPVIDLTKGERVSISFDDLTHEYHRYVYRVQHCNSDWQPSEELFESDFIESTTDEEVIEDYQQSLNTSVLYTHYSFQLPNKNVRPILSGNYRVIISGEDEEGTLQPVAEACFSVVEQVVGISPSMTTNTDIDLNRSHQQLSMEVKWGDLTIRDAKKEIWTVITQNGRWDNAVIRPNPTSVTGTSLIWDHHRSLIFEAGNEYRKFEMLSTRYPGMHMESMRWYAPFYHATLMTDAPRRNYLYDEDADGIAVIRKEGSGNADTEADYVFTHFALSTDSLPNTDLYVCGDWTQYAFSPQYKMNYNTETNSYETSVFLKQGYYNYMYLAIDKAQPTRGMTRNIEGDFFQTENKYSIYIYYRRMGDRYDRLVGFISPTYHHK